MEDQPRVETYEASAFFSDGQGSRPQVPGTIARGQTWEATPFLTGQDGREFVSNPEAITSGRLQHGRKLYDVNCDHCHGLSGYGDGMVVQRGFPTPPSYHIDRLRDAPDGRLFEVITRGHGRMPALGNLIAPADRWAIVAYVRALQLSQNMPEAELTAADREALAAVKEEP